MSEYQCFMNYPEIISIISETGGYFSSMKGI